MLTKCIQRAKTLPKIRKMMHLNIFLIILVASGCRALTSSDLQSNITTNQLNQTRPSSELIKQDDSDDKLSDESIAEANWLLSSPYLTAATLGGAASMALSDTALDASQIEDIIYDGRKGTFTPGYESSQVAVLSGKIVPGKRRFDEENIALASTGQTAENKFLIPQADLMSIYGRSDVSKKMSKRFDHDDYEAEATPKSRRQPKRRIQVGEKASNLNRKGRKMERRQSNRFQNSDAKNAKRLKDQVRSAQSRAGRVRAKGDKIFNDDDDTDQAANAMKRRAGVHEKAVDDSNDDDGENDDDDDGEENTPKVKKNVRTNRQSTAAASRRRMEKSRPRVRQSRQRVLAGSELKKPSNDEDSDSSNQQQQQSLIQTEDLVRHPRLTEQLHADQPTEIEASLDDIDEASSANQLMHSAEELQTAAGHHHDHHHGYYQYAGVPKKKAWKFGFKRGNHKHTSKYRLATRIQ